MRRFFVAFFCLILISASQARADEMDQFFDYFVQCSTEFSNLPQTLLNPESYSTTSISDLLTYFLNIIDAYHASLMTAQCREWSFHTNKLADMKRMDDWILNRINKKLGAQLVVNNLDLFIPKLKGNIQSVEKLINTSSNEKLILFGKQFIKKLKELSPVLEAMQKKYSKRAASQ